MKKEDVKKQEPKPVMTFQRCREEVASYLDEVIAYLNETKTMSHLDPMPISILGVQLNIFAECAAHISAEGLMVHDEKDNLVPNPKIAVMNQAETMALKIMKEYGLMPKARKELGKGAEPKRDSPLAAFLKK